MNTQTHLQRVLVTAAGSGIGRAIAEAFYRRNALVHICDISKAAIDETLEANPKMKATVADISQPNQVDQLFKNAIEWLGGVDVLVNNAGIGGPRAPLDEIDDDDWNQTMQINVNGAFYCIKRAAKYMKPQNNGCIINISSASARTGLPLRAPYVTSKVALQGLTRNVARELGPYNISCNAILPGAIDNERGHMLIERLAQERNQSIAEAEAQRMAYISMRTRIKPSEIGDTAVFLANNGRHISGQEIGLCGNSEWEE
jgi:NAD(P)-dependent dehydrogenase (short-subunit alcohol dehydrogenase family)